MLARRLAGRSFRRADTQRDERGVESGHAVERALRNLSGWLPPRQLSRRDIESFARAIDQCTHTLNSLTDAALVGLFHSVLLDLKAGDRKDHEIALAAAFACAGVASKRALGLWPYPVQFSGALQLMNGRLAEMRTGEGKTLVAALAATVMAGAGASVHVVSTNDYLAQRDSEEMGRLFSFFGMSVGHVVSGMRAEERMLAYRQPICYVSGKELVFDYLKDRLSGHGQIPSRVMHLRRAWQSDSAESEHGQDALIPALHFAIVDEADSVLIDEASTPMILSREVPSSYEPVLMHWSIQAARALIAGQHFRFTDGRSLDLLPSALSHCPPLPGGVRAAWQSKAWREMLIRQALKAIHLFQRDQHYILADGKVQIVDESTGRVMPDRSWEQGLHQMIEAKEGLELTLGRETLARMTFQRFFRRYYLLSGLTGTATEASRELWDVYRLRVCRIPPNRKDRRNILPSRCLATTQAKWIAVAQDAMQEAANGRAVLIGTRSVEASEQVSAELKCHGIAHVVLNARQDKEEADIVARAGRSGQITVATNMAGRGTDIKLDAQAQSAGGLHVILSEFHESPRVDRQLFGRSGRQGERGSVRAIVSVEDMIFKDSSPSLRKWIVRMRGAGQAAMLAQLVKRAQSTMERRAYKARMQTLTQDRNLSRLIGFAGPTG